MMLPIDKKSSKTLSRFAGALLAIWLAAPPVYAATIIAQNTTLSAVQAAVDSANNGDTVVVPAGVSTWSGTLRVTKCITLQGAGTNSTQIAGSGTLVDLSPSTDLKLRITGFYFDLGSFSRSDHTAIYLGAPNTNLRIDHCRFRGGSKVIWMQYKGYGVVDHCFFLDSDGEIYPWMGGNWDLGQTSWTWGVQPGSANTLVVEDCHFYRSSAIDGNLVDEVVYGQAGARVMFRYNRITQNTPNSDAYMVDAHGSFWAGNAKLRGTAFYEIYGNVFDCTTSYRCFNLRGGTHLVYSNTFTGNIGIMFQLKNEGVSTSGSFDADDRIVNSFFWGNQVNGSIPSDQGIDVEGGSEPYVVLNTHYFTRPIRSGDALYPYTPLVYPHPRVTTDSGGATTPIISVSVSSVDITLPQGATTNLTITVRNVGTNTLSGSASLSVINPFTISGNTTYSLGAGASTSFTLSYAQSAAVASSATLNFTGGGGASVPLKGGLPKTYIECLGDSLTRGGSSTTTNFVAGGYRLRLYQLLTNSGVNAVFTGTASDNSAAGLPYPEHDGYGGYEIGDVSSSYATYAQAIHPPDYVLVQCGINDFRHNNAITTAINRLSSLVDEIHDSFPAAKIIVTDMNPWDNLGATNSAMNAYYNPNIPGMVANQAALGRSVYLADMRQPYMTVADVQGDNTHFTQSGYNKMATNLMSVISMIKSGGTNKPASPTNLRLAGQ